MSHRHTSPPNKRSQHANVERSGGRLATHAAVGTGNAAKWHISEQECNPRRVHRLSSIMECVAPSRPERVAATGTPAQWLGRMLHQRAIDVQDACLLRWYVVDTGYLSCILILVFLFFFILACCQLLALTLLPWLTGTPACGGRR